MNNVDLSCTGENINESNAVNHCVTNLTHRDAFIHSSQEFINVWRTLKFVFKPWTRSFSKKHSLLFNMTWSIWMIPDITTVSRLQLTNIFLVFSNYHAPVEPLLMLLFDLSVNSSTSYFLLALLVWGPFSSEKKESVLLNTRAISTFTSRADHIPQAGKQLMQCHDLEPRRPSNKAERCLPDTVL